MRIFDGKTYRDMTEEEILSMQTAAEQAERDYWQTVDYDEAVNAEIRKKYSESQEFAILRQQASKPQEYADYFAYCEACKLFVRGKMEQFPAPPISE